MLFHRGIEHLGSSLLVGHTYQFFGLHRYVEAGVVLYKNKVVGHFGDYAATGLVKEFYFIAYFKMCH